MHKKKSTSETNKKSKNAAIALYFFLLNWPQNNCAKKIRMETKKTAMAVWPQEDGRHTIAVPVGSQAGYRVVAHTIVPMMQNGHKTAKLT